MPDTRLLEKALLTLAWIILISLPEAKSQSTLEANAGAIHAFNHKTQHLGEDEIQTIGWGVMAHIDFTYKQEHWRFEPGIGGGVKQIYTSGSVGRYDFHSQSTKLIALLYCHFLINQSWKVGALFLSENNKDFEDFKRKSNDQYRYNAGLEVTYQQNDLGIYLRYTRSLYPNVNLYLIKNPTDQISLGVSYKLLKL